MAEDDLSDLDRLLELVRFGEDVPSEDRYKSHRKYWALIRESMNRMLVVLESERQLDGDDVELDLLAETIGFDLISFANQVGRFTRRDDDPPPG